MNTEHRFDTGAAWLDLLATLGHAYGEVSIERLPDVDALRTWLDHERLTPEAPLRAADVATVRELRETLRPVVLAVLDGRPPSVAPHCWDRSARSGRRSPASAGATRIGRRSSSPPSATSVS